MRLLVVGGKLQGVEAVYLAKKTGWHVTVMDKRTHVPASALCDDFIQFDLSCDKQFERIARKVDVILPALENRDALDTLCRMAKQTRTPLAFDSSAYAVSSSKIFSDRLFRRMGIPAPLPWPECGLPVVVKPSVGSGSDEVRICHAQDQLPRDLAGDGPSGGWVCQQYLPGPSYSLEVIGTPGNYRLLQVTELFMDPIFDCKRVTAPSPLSSKLTARFETVAKALATEIGLSGLMDVEVILHGGRLKVLEIDARLPSQTPTAVFWCTGLNMVQMLCKQAMGRAPLENVQKKRNRGVIYEHILVEPGKIEVAGEHIMGGAGPLFLKTGFFGADEALTNYDPGKKRWVATLIISASTLAAAWKKRRRVLEEIQKATSALSILDPEPKPAFKGQQNGPCLSTAPSFLAVGKSFSAKKTSGRGTVSKPAAGKLSGSASALAADASTADAFSGPVYRSTADAFSGPASRSTADAISGSDSNSTANAFSDPISEKASGSQAINTGKRNTSHASASATISGARS